MNRALAVILLAVVAPACEEESPGAKGPIPGTDRADQGPDGTTVDARLVQRLAEATCEREQSCGTIGPGAYFKSREDCIGSMHTKLDPELNPSMCPRGIDRGAFEGCISSLRSNECTQPSDQITRAARCSPSDLCMK
jgi:hypothetical protein